MTLKIPEPFERALKEGRPADVCDVEVVLPQAFYGRALARIRLGRFREARVDLEAAYASLGDPCGVELASLDLIEGKAMDAALRIVMEVLSRAVEKTPLRARALHVLGIARWKLAQPQQAMDALHEALCVYRESGDRLGKAQVQDTLGSLHASQGNLELALTGYSISLAEKALLADRYGMGITLGNLGRVHLRAGRIQDALDCFELDYQIASELGDKKGRARMLNDIGRTRLSLEDIKGAEDSLRRSLQIALEEGYRDVEFFVRKDLGLLKALKGEFAEGASELDRAEQLLEGAADPYAYAILTAARGEFALARKAPEALSTLEEAVREFVKIDIPDQEIPLRIQLARAYEQEKHKRTAEICLEAALERARRGGYERYLRQIREEMARIGWGGGMVEEKGRWSGPAGRENLPGGYVVFEKLGEGHFGEVYRAFDPLRDQFVALKCVSLCKIYDVRKRQELMNSARLELEVASRIHHPGLARVFAMGYDESGNCYIAQEFVKGRTLLELMRSSPKPDSLHVLKKTRLVANALDALHSKNVVHRDIKPENVLLRAPDDAPVLVDFGIAFVPDFEGGFAPSQVVGTLPFMAPEILRGAPPESKSDMYALGVLLYEWLAARLPWDLEEKSWSAAIQEKLHVEPLALVEVRPDLSKDLVGLVEQLMDLDPDRRPTAAMVAEFCERIEGDDKMLRDVGAGIESRTTLLTAGFARNPSLRNFSAKCGEVSGKDSMMDGNFDLGAR